MCGDGEEREDALNPFLGGEPPPFFARGRGGEEKRSLFLKARTLKPVSLPPPPSVIKPILFLWPPPPPPPPLSSHGATSSSEYVCESVRVHTRDT